MIICQKCKIPYDDCLCDVGNCKKAEINTFCRIALIIAGTLVIIISLPFCVVFVGFIPMFVGIEMIEIACGKLT